MYIKRLIPLTLLTISVGYARTKMAASITKIECPIYAPNLVKNVSCSVNRTSQGTGTFSVEFMLTETIKDASGKYIVNIKQGSSSITKYLSTKLDYCKVLGRLHKNYLLRTFTAELRRVSNLPLKCPFEKNKLYYVKGFSIDTSALTSYIPELDFIGHTQFTSNKKKLGQVIVYGSFSRG